MARRIIVLLIATLALVTSAYALKGKKPEKRAVAAITTNIPALKLDVLPVETFADKQNPTPSHAAVLTTRLAILALLAIALATGAYFGLGRGSETARAENMAQIDSLSSSSPHVQTGFAVQKSVASEAAPAPAADDELRSLFARGAAFVAPPAAPTPSPTDAPAPPPAVAAEVQTPEPVAAPAAVAPLPADGIEAIICALPWPCQEAINVAACESGRDMNGRLDGAYATNGANYGLFQINGIHASRWADFYDAWMDPARNAQFAYDIWAQQGWYPWSCRWAAYY